MNDKAEIDEQLSNDVRCDDSSRIDFDPNDWEEVPFSALNTKVSNNEANMTAVSQIDNCGTLQSTRLEKNEAASAGAVPPSSSTSNQVFLLEYGKKFTKYKKYKQFESYFQEKYERNLYFDPEEKHFITPDGLKFSAEPGNSVGTSLLFESSSKTLAGFSNIAYNLELSTMNKALQDQIDLENNSNNAYISTNGSSNNGLVQHTNGKIEDEHQQKNGQTGQVTKNKSNNNLESIFDWIEKKDKLNKKRIQKRNKTLITASKDSFSQNEGNTHSQSKGKRQVSMNYLLRKLEK